MHSKARKPYNTFYKDKKIKIDSRLSPIVLT